MVEESFPSARLPKILFVESHSTLRDVLSQLLALSGNYDLSVAQSGPACLTAVQHQKPDLIVTGLRMPTMDGFMLIQTLRGNLTTTDIPILVLSTWSTAKHMERAFATGANDYLTLPVETARLIERINALLG